MKRLRDTKVKKAFWGTVLPIASAVIGSIGSIVGGNEQRKAQEKQAKEMMRVQAENDRLQTLNASRDTMNNYFNNTTSPYELENNVWIGKYGGCAGRRKLKLGGSYLKGGVAVPVAPNVSLLRGRKHSNGGIKHIENGKTIAEYQDREIKREIPGNVLIYSADLPVGPNGETPAEMALADADNPQKLDRDFIIQEVYKQALGLNDDGTTKASSPLRKRHSIKKAPYGTALSPLPGYNAFSTLLGQGLAYYNSRAPYYASRPEYWWDFSKTNSSSPYTGSMWKRTPRLDTDKGLTRINTNGTESPLYKNRQNWLRNIGESIGSDWYGGINKPVDYVQLAANTILPFFAYNKSRSDINRYRDVLADYQKRIEGMTFNRPVYTSSRARVDYGSEREAAQRDYMDNVTRTMRNSASSSVGLERGNVLATNRLEAINKSLENEANKNAELRVADDQARNEFNARVAAAEADFERARLSSFGDLAAKRLDVERSNAENNEGLIQALISGIGGFNQAGMDRLKDRQEILLALSQVSPETVDRLISTNPYLGNIKRRRLRNVEIV